MSEFMSPSDPNPDKPLGAFFWTIVCCGCIAMLLSVLIVNLAIINRLHPKRSAEMENKKISVIYKRATPDLIIF